MRLNVFLLAILLTVFCISPIAIAQEEEKEEEVGITLTTYYPAPYGDYDALSANTLNAGTLHADPLPDGPDGISDNADDNIDDFVVTSTGNVGIGTTSPNAKLEVSGEVLFAPMDPPTSPQPGMIYYDQTSHVMRYYKGGTSPGWVAMGGGVSLGEWETKSVGILYGPTSTDGFVVAYAGNQALLTGLINGEERVKSGDEWPPSVPSMTMPVKEGSNWQVTVDRSVTVTVYWIPLGD